jgi:saxitoxin biosynthesis operon SxtJ-like protein
VEDRVPHPIATPLSAAEGRRFGLLVGGAFVGLAGLTAWRGHATEAWILGSAGTVLAAGALVAPRRLEPVRRWWLRLAEAISSVTTPVLMGVIYFAIVTPIGWVRRLAGGNRLVRRRTSKTFWVERDGESGQRVNMEHQF